MHVQKGERYRDKEKFHRRKIEQDSHRSATLDRLFVRKFLSRDTAIEYKPEWYQGNVLEGRAFQAEEIETEKGLG